MIEPEINSFSSVPSELAKDIFLKLLNDYCQQPFSSELSKIKLILSFWAEVLSLGRWRKKPLSECLLEDIKIQEVFHQEIDTLVRESPEAREQLRELVIALRVQAIQAPFWQHNFIGRARAFADLAEDVLKNNVIASVPALSDSEAG